MLRFKNYCIICGLFTQNAPEPGHIADENKSAPAVAIIYSAAGSGTAASSSLPEGE